MERSPQGELLPYIRGLAVRTISCKREVNYEENCLAYTEGFS